MKLSRIVTGPRPARLTRYASEELANYVRRLFGARPRIVMNPGRATGLTVRMSASASDLSDQGYRLRPVDERTFAIDAGSPVALMWGVYDLVERWGVRYELHGDILPDRPGAMRLPDRTVTCEPDLKLRAFRTYNDFANNPSHWAAEDYRLLLDQLAKMRYNGIAFCVGPYDPFIDLRFRGARKTLATPDFNWRPHIRPDHPGYDLFVASGDAQRGEFVSRDLTGHESYDAAIAAAQSYARKVFRMAHARGMRCIVHAPVADFDPKIRKRIAELTLPRHKTKRSTAVRICYGDWQEGPDVETGRCMNARNPVFLDAITANIQAHIDALPDADAFFFSSTEFGGSGADCERAWRALDRKYDLGRIRTLPALLHDARRHAEEDPVRSERELRADIVLLDSFDRLINERGFDMSRARKGCVVMPGALSPEVHQLLPGIFEHGSHYLSFYGYVPAYVATRTDTLRLKDPGAIRFTQVVSAEDDNVGLLPQFCGPAVHLIVEALRAAGAHGLQTRHWMHSNLLPTFHYLAHAAWEGGWTPNKAYRHLYGPTCGPAATPHVMKAFKRLERITDHLHRNIICISFAVPMWITTFWESWPEKVTLPLLTRIARAYRTSADDLARAIKASRPAGRDHLEGLERHVRHGDHYCRALIALRQARDAEDAAAAVQDGEDGEQMLYGKLGGSRFDRLFTARKAVTRHLAEAEARMRTCCEIYAQGVRDRVDLGALATLNCYNLDVIAALARIAKAKGDMFSCRED
ncbi:MAG: hypothetical protein CMJ18_07295 [Phycisphaeraceae bacterium]|nr:hypothetical protein [Phycisphaeraceae bacterium]